MTPPTPAATQITIGRGADADFAALGICPGEENFRERRRIVVDAFRQFAEPLPACREVQYLARTVVDGREVVLLCICHEGSTLGDRDQTTIVRGAFTPERTAELMALRRGLAPFANELCGRRSAKKVTNGESSHDGNKVAIVA